MEYEIYVIETGAVLAKGSLREYARRTRRGNMVTIRIHTPLTRAWTRVWNLSQKRNIPYRDLNIRIV